MIIDLNHYNNIRPTVKNVALNNSSKSHKEIISLIAIASYAPAIVSCYYYIEHLGHSPKEVQQQIDKLISFYRYTKIISIKDQADV
jgi:hypothetical protein